MKKLGSGKRFGFQKKLGFRKSHGFWKSLGVTGWNVSVLRKKTNLTETGMSRFFKWILLATRLDESSGILGKMYTTRLAGILDT